MSQKNPSVSELIRAASGPCLVIREGDIPAIRKKRKDASWAAAAFTRIKGSAESWMKKEIQIPDRGGQWPHWYACEVDAAPLKMQSPTVHRCPKCHRVYSGEPWDSVHLTKVHEGLADAVRNLGVYHALTGSRRAAQKAAQILLGYAEMYPRYPVRDHGQNTDTAWATKVSWGTLGESVWLLPICGGYDLIRHADVLTPAEHQYIREQLLRPAARLILKHNLGVHNIQCWHNAAIASVGLLLKDRDLVSFAVEGEVGIQAQIARGVLRDGFWFEGSWGYHFYGMRPLLALTETLRNCGMDLYDDHLMKMFEAPLLAAEPDGRMPTFHDSGAPPLSETDHLYEIGYARYNNTRFALPLLGSDRKSLNALLYGSAELPEQVQETTESSHLARSGFVYLRQGSGEKQSYLAFDYGPHGGGHGHPDKLSFILFGKGKVLAPDPSSPAYGVPHYSGWYKQTVSHNTLAVDSKSQKGSRGTLNFLVNGSDFDLLSASTEEAYEKVKLSRTLLFKEDLVLFIDRLSGARSHTFDWIYHNRGDIRTTFARKPMKVSPGEAHGYDWIEDARLGEPRGDWQVNWRAGEAGVRLTMLGSNKVPTEVITGMGLDNTETSLGAPGDAPTPLVIARRRDRRTTFRAALQVYGKRAVTEEISRAKVDPPGRARGVTLVRNNSNITLIVSLSPGPVTWNRLTYEGQALYVEQSPKMQDRIVLVGGTCLHWEDRTWHLDPVGSVQINIESDTPEVTNIGSDAVAVRVDGNTYPLAPCETARFDLS